jgi:hypothetical protein
MGEIDRQEFTQRWIQNLMSSMEAHLDEGTRARVMESCGRACARAGPVHAAMECQGDLDAWLDRLTRWHGGRENVRREGDAVHLICEQCLCPLVQDAPERLPDTYCACSLGWMKETFGTVLGRPVQVSLLESILRGGERCRFVVEL